jgi:CBS domain-containing protein
MKTLSQIIASRNNGVIAVGPRESVRHALQLMAEHEIGALLVMDKGKLVGVVSERDYARKIALRGKLSEDTPVQDIMTNQVVCAWLQTSVDEAMATMSEHHVRHLPVLDDYKDVVGVVSMRDLIQDTIAEQTFVIHQLESYITH